MKYKILLWENIPSIHHQGFIKALIDKNIDIQARYFEKFHNERKKQKWNIELIEGVEECVEDNVEVALQTVKDWRERIHIIPGNSYKFINELLEVLIKNDIKWIHWSERSGIRLMKKLNYNEFLFNMFHPLSVKIKKRKYAKLINKYALGAFAQGYLAKEDFKLWGIDEKKIEYLFYTIDTTSYITKKVEDIKNNKKVFLYIGSLSFRKGIDILLKSFLKVQNKDWKLILIGPDFSNGEYQNFVKDNNIKNVEFLGPKDSTDIINYMKQADVFILPSRFDGWGAVLNEAAFAKKPIISTTQTGAAYHLIEPNKNGFRIISGNQKELSKAMEFFIKNPEKIDIYSENSGKIYKNFTPEKNVERLINAIDKWMKKGN